MPRLGRRRGFVKVLPGELDGGGSFADSQGDPLDGAVADVTDAYARGRLISSGNGCRSSGQFDGGLRSRRWRPVTTNPWSARSITVASQLAWGSAPMRMNGAAVGKVSSVPGTAVADSERFQPPRLVDGG